MSISDENQPIEEVRVIVPNARLCAEITAAFTDENIAAFGDYRDHAEEVLARDAFNDRVDYIVYLNLSHMYERVNLRAQATRDIVTKVYLRREGEVKSMTVGAAIKMVLQRRAM